MTDYRSFAERRAAWARRLPAIRRARARGESYQHIARRYGVSRYAIYLLCKAHGIQSPTAGRYHPRRLDRAKAQQITEQKRRFWLGAA